MLEDAESIKVRHVHVQDHGVGVNVRDALEGFVTVTGSEDLIPGKLQPRHQQLEDHGVVIDHEDMGRFMVALLRDRRMLEAHTLRRMLAPSRHEAGYGLGIERSNTGWGMAYGHSGRVTGFNSDAWYYADRQTAIVFITNGDYGDDDSANIVEQVADIVFK